MSLWVGDSDIVAAAGRKANKGEAIKLNGACYQRVNDDPVPKGAQGSIFDGAIGAEITDNCVACDSGAAAANTYAALFTTNTEFDGTYSAFAGANSETAAKARKWPEQFSTSQATLSALMSDSDQLPSGVGGTNGYDLEKGAVNTGKLLDLYLKIFEFAESKASTNAERSIDPAATVINPDADSFAIGYDTTNGPQTMNLKHDDTEDLKEWFWTLNNAAAWSTDATHAASLNDVWYLYSIFPKGMFDRFKIGSAGEQSVINDNYYTNGLAADVNMATGAINGYKVSVLGLGSVSLAEHNLTGGHGTGGKLLVTDNTLPAGLGSAGGFLPPAINAISAGGSGYMVGDELEVHDGAKIVVTSIDEADLLHTVVKLPANAANEQGGHLLVTIDVPA